MTKPPIVFPFFEFNVHVDALIILISIGFDFKVIKIVKGLLYQSLSCFAFLFLCISFILISIFLHFCKIPFCQTIHGRQR